MKGFLIFCFLIGQCLLATAQQADSTQSAVILDEVVVSATRTSHLVTELPMQAALISASRIHSFPLANLDDVLKSVANVYVNRSWGIFSKNAAVTMRGLESADRVLVLVDGVPKNRIAGGSVNWHNVNPDLIEKIEVIKGPASSLYGNNAMAGVINIITRRPANDKSASATLSYGSYNTMAQSTQVSGNRIKNQKGWYWNINSYYRKGDGYVFEAPEYLDENDIKTGLKEGGAGIKAGYQFDSSNYIDFVYDVYNEERGGGQKIFTSKGNFEEYLTNNFRLSTNNLLAGGRFQASVYYSAENYYGQKESLNDDFAYKLLDSYADRVDMGLFSYWSKTLFPGNLFTLGLEIKSGSLVSHELYRSSPDEIKGESKMDIYGLFAQDEIGLFDNKLQCILGLRGDMARFYDGFQQIKNPTKATGFKQSFTENFSPSGWTALSPKISVQSQLTPLLKLYVSVGIGFKPPKLKDLAQSGKINKGFRLANPTLKPEYLTNYEVGYTIRPFSDCSINGAVYYAIGTDLQYSLSTGDSIDTGGSSLKPVIITDNIARGRVAGSEISFRYHPIRQLQFNINASYNHSVILEYRPSDINPDLNLNNKMMVEVPPLLFYAGCDWRNRHFSLAINASYVDKQWYDVENTTRVNAWFLANARISRVFFNKLEAALDVQNIFDKAYIDRKGQLSPGRFVVFSLQYQFNYSLK